MFTPLKLVSADPRPIPIVTLKDGRIERWRPSILTLGDALDYGFAVVVRCRCSQRVVVMSPAAFLQRHRPVPETTHLADLGQHLVCSKCGRKDGISTSTDEKPCPGQPPRKQPNENPWFGVW
ncbi:hypothetical protein QMT40_002972 [Parvibaculaceae bacterium PLY_AMNH_Bact1]|nr:hypothetical protein QMT40_002972 [Parvibaculaceae bacterium PLY_AMNH_Bact1]